MELQEILDCAIQVGYELSTSGAEIYRVEQSIFFICEAYGVSDVHVFAIPSSIVVTVSDGAQFLTRTKRVTTHSTNLDRVERLTDLSRMLCQEKPSYQVALQKLQEIRQRPLYSNLSRYLAGLLVGFSFALFFGGEFPDALLALGIGGLVVWLMDFLEGLHTNSFFINVICGFFAALLAYWPASCVPWLHADKVIIGVIMILVPGLAIANSMRDFMASDTVAGISRITDALLTAVGIALGVALAMMVVF